MRAVRGVGGTRRRAWSDAPRRFPPQWHLRHKGLQRQLGILRSWWSAPEVPPFAGGVPSRDALLEFPNTLLEVPMRPALPPHNLPAASPINVHWRRIMPQGMASHRPKPRLGGRRTTADHTCASQRAGALSVSAKCRPDSGMEMFRKSGKTRARQKSSPNAPPITTGSRGPFNLFSCDINESCPRLYFVRCDGL